MSLLLQVNIPTPTVIPPDSVRKVTENIISQIQTDPDAFWHELLQNAIHFGLKVLAAIIIYSLGAWMISWIKRLLKKMFVRRNTERTLASFISSFVSIMLTIILVIVTVGTLGVDTTSLAALLAAGGMAIGMALSGTVQNFAGGIMIMVFKPFKAGDWIAAQGFSGTVLEVNITATKILTIDNRVIVLPNGSLSNGAIDNHSARPLRRVEWKVSVSYGIDAEECRLTILDMLNSDSRILNSSVNTNELYKEFDEKQYQTSVGYKLDTVPDPFVALFSLNENDITFVVRAWLRGADYWNVYFEMNQRFYTELPQKGFTFAYPHMDVTMLNQNGTIIADL